MTTTRMLAIIAGAGLALVVAIGFLYSVSKDVGPFGGAHHTRTETRVVTEPVRSLVVETDAGGVEVVRGERLALVETTSYRGSGAAPHAEHQLSDGELTVKNPSCHDCATSFRVELPAGVALRASSHAGDVRGQDLDVPELRLSSDAGNVTAALVRAPRLIDAQSDAGDISLTVPPGRYAVDTDTDAGEEDVTGIVDDPSAPNKIDARTDAGDVTINAR
jgi:hypothetical protein